MLPTTKESPKKVFKNAKIISEDATSFTVEFDTFGTTEELFTKEDGSVGSFVVPNEQLPEMRLLPERPLRQARPTRRRARPILTWPAMRPGYSEILLRAV